MKGRDVVVKVAVPRQSVPLDDHIREIANALVTTVDGITS